MRQSADEADDDEDYPERRRRYSTPVSEAASILGSLSEIHESWFPEQDFITAVFKPMWDDDTTSGALQLDELQKAEDSEYWPGDDQQKLTPESREAVVKLALLMTVCAFCIQTFKSEKGSTQALSFVVDAARWLGILQGYMSGTAVRRTAKSDLAKLGAIARHASNRQDKRRVFDWCDANMARFASMDDAALDIAETFVPQKFRTVREWMTEWKKLRPASKP